MRPSIGSVWIRRSKNVKVRVCPTNRGGNTFFEYKGNNHTNRMPESQFLDEFVELQPILDVVTVGSPWLARKESYLAKLHPRTFYVCEIDSRTGMVRYRYDTADGPAQFQVSIGQFLDKFEPKK